MTKMCSICKTEVDSENSAILAMGGFGNPKYICDDCSDELDVVMRGRSYEKIVKSMAIISDKISKSSIDDQLTVETVENIFSAAKDRAEKIKNGEYNFEEDIEKDEGDIDVPEELRETEEDKKLDEEDRIEHEKMNERSRKFDMFFFYPFLGLIFLGALAYIIHGFFEA